MSNRQLLFDRGGTVTACAPRAAMVCYRFRIAAAPDEDEDAEPSPEQRSCFATLPDCESDSAWRRQNNRTGRFSDFSACAPVTNADLRRAQIPTPSEPVAARPPASTADGGAR